MTTAIAFTTHYLAHRTKMPVRAGQVMAGLRRRETIKLENAAGCIFLRPSPWDDSVFGRKTYIIDAAFSDRDSDKAAKRLIEDLNERLINDQVAFAVWRMGGGLDHFSGHLLQGGWRLADKLVVFIDVPTANHRRGPDIRTVTPKDNEMVRAIAKNALAHGRIQNDPTFSTEIKERFVEAMADALLRHGTSMVVVDSSGHPAGFVDGGIDPFVSEALGEREGSLGLIAVDPANKGHGYGRALYDAFMAQMYETGARRVEICTQIDNIQAQALYRAVGAEPSGAIATFHWHRGAMQGSRP